MKIKILFYIPALVCLLAASADPALAQSTAFTYQGRLNSGANPANGTYDLTFSLFNVSSGAGQVGSTYPTPNAAVSNGLFTVTLDFGASIFTGPARWLEIGVRTNGSVAAYSLLSPRQALTPAPYAIFANSSSNVVSGAVVKSLNTLRDDVTLAQGANVTITPSGNTLTIASTGGGSGIWSLNGASAYYNGGNVGIGLVNPGARVHINQAASGVGLFVGNRTPFGQALFETDIATSGTHAWFAEGGTNVFSVTGGGNGYFKANLSVGADATVTGSASIGGDISAGNNLSAGANFYMGDGILGSSGEVHIYGQRIFPAFAPERFTINAAGNVTINTNLFFGAQTRQMINLYGGGYGIGVQNYTLYSRSGGGFAWYLGGGHNDNQNNAGGGYTLMTLDGAGNLNVKANASVCSLTIRGGCDVAEPFQMSHQEVPKGSVVVIDDENAGQLKLSDRAYDSHVAGIVSGGNGINPGISLSQEGILEGGQNVALSGRVYVLADAANGAIKPGDLLTTSGTPGHAMKVFNHNQAQGAILGKAMSSLKEGKGMVLVLVTLQ